MEAVNPQEQVTEKPAMEPRWAADQMVVSTGAESRWVKGILQGQGLVALCSRHTHNLRPSLDSVKHYAQPITPPVP